MIYVSGCTDTHPDRTISEVLAGQFRENFRNITAIIEHAPTGFGDVDDMTSYHAGIEKIELVERIKDDFVIGPYTARTSIGFASLVVCEALVETESASRIPSTTDRSA